ncbi:hypothetical protein AB751O23_AH_00010, partial [Chlamydiales bacterium SCGC AB-751-O23]
LKDEKEITCFEEALPHTNLPDKTYDIIFFLDAIAYFEEEDMRLVFSELQRLLKSDGIIVISSPLDLHSYDALEKFIDLFSTEFDVLEKKTSHHLLFLKLRHFLQKIQNLEKACIFQHFKKEEIKKAKFMYRSFLKLLATKKLHRALKPLASWSKQLQSHLEKSSKAPIALEKITRFILPNSTASHCILSGKRKPLFPSNSQEENKKRPPSPETDLYDSLYEK